MSTKKKQIVLPVITAFIWGCAFVAQKSGAENVGAFTFTWMRYLLAGLVLLAFLALRTKRDGRTLHEVFAGALPSGVVMGTLLMVASNLQQYGMNTTTASKAGFVTTLYIVIVPLLGLFFHKRVRALVWCGVAVAVAGLYLLSFAEGGTPSFNEGDLYVLGCALVFSIHILAIDHYTKFYEGVVLACLQFFVAAAESLVPALLFEGFSAPAILDCALPILYAGIISGGVGYTLQIVAQKDGDPTVVSLLLSLESLFAVVSGALLLHERLSPREYLGCALMLCAVVLVQLPEKKQRRRKKVR